MLLRNKNAIDHMQYSVAARPVCEVLAGIVPGYFVDRCRGGITCALKKDVIKVERGTADLYFTTNKRGEAIWRSSTQPKHIAGKQSAGEDMVFHERCQLIRIRRHDTAYGGKVHI